MGKDLFGGGSGSDDDDVGLKTNKEYAKSYNKFRQKELLKKLKDRDQEDSNSDSSSSDTDSSDSEVVDPKFDQKFLQALASLKSKDPKIYDKNTTFFDGDEGDEAIAAKKKKKEKALTLKDYERKVIVERGGVYEDDEDETPKDRPVSPTYAEEQKILKSEIKKTLENEDSEDEEFGGLFKRREKSKKELDNEEQQYLKWLAGQEEANIGETGEKLKPLKEYWSDPKLSKREQFLRDYILHNGYMDFDAEEIPTYEEIVDDKEDEDYLERQAEFEHKYNFRFEEPDQEFIKRYPRTIEASVRKKDETRKQKRQEVKERKEREKEQKFQELQVLKELKRKEIEEKIEKLKEVTGNEELAFKDIDLEEDFDPEAHDKRMKELFDEQYYAEDVDDDKPECPDIEDLKVEDWDNYDPNNDEDDVVCDYEPHCEDENFNMDCDYDPSVDNQKSLQDELIENTKSRKNRRRRANKFMEMIKKEKPVFKPEDEKTYAEYIDEYYNMDCEDIIGDIPCRFKYVETVPNDFGLTIEEILLAKNKELNQWASLKKAVQIRPEHVERNEAKMYRLKAQNEALKRKIFVSLYGPPSEGEDEEEDEKPSKKEEPSTANETNPENKKKKKRRKRKGLDGALENEKNLSQTDSNNGGDSPQEKSAEKSEPVLKKIKLDDAEHKEIAEVKTAETKLKTKKIKKIKANSKTKSIANGKLSETKKSTKIIKAGKKKTLQANNATKLNGNPVNGNIKNPLKNIKNPLNKNIKNPFNTNKKNLINKNVKNPFNANSKTPINENVEKPFNSNLKSSINKNMRNPFNANSKTPINENVEKPFNSNSKSPINKNMRNPFNANSKTPINENVEKPFNSNSKSPINKNMRNPFNANSKSPVNKNMKNPFNANSKSLVSKNIKNTFNANSKIPVNKNVKNPFRTNDNGSKPADGLTDERLKAYGINPKKFRKKQKYGNQQNKSKT